MSNTLETINTVLEMHEFHLNTISLILGIVSVIFVVLGVVSYRQVMGHIKKSINEKVVEKVHQELDKANINKMIQNKLNDKVENLHITIDELHNEPNQTETEL